MGSGKVRPEHCSLHSIPSVAVAAVESDSNVPASRDDLEDFYGQISCEQRKFESPER
jgi:hypothetical protein